MPNRMEELASKGMGKVKSAKATVKGLKGIFKTLAEEHGEVSALLKRVKGSSDTRVREELFPKIRSELLSHERGELTELYPLLEGHPETRDIAIEHDEEAEEIEALLERLNATPFDSTQWSSDFDELVELVQHHATEEENEYFPRAQRVLGEDRAKELDKKFRDKKQQLMREIV